MNHTHFHLNWLLGNISLENKTVLDLGCGPGDFCRAIAHYRPKRVVGVDVVPPKNTEGIEFLPLDLDGQFSNALAAQTYDIITAFDVIEHLASPPHFLKQCQSLLNKGGLLVVTTPNTQSWERFVHPRQWSGATDPQHKILFNTYSLGFLMERTGFKVQSLSAPVRKCMRLGLPSFNLGGQILCAASLRSEGLK